MVTDIFTLDNKKVYPHMVVSTADASMDNITFAMLKWDAVHNKVHSQIIDVLNEAGFQIIHHSNMNLTVEQALRFYDAHIGKPYFSDLICSIRDTVVPMILEYTQPNGTDTAVSALLNLIGATNALFAAPHTIRARFGGHMFDPAAPLAANAIHASDSPASVLREVAIIFPHVNLEDILLQRKFDVAHQHPTDVVSDTSS